MLLPEAAGELNRGPSKLKDKWDWQDVFRERKMWLLPWMFLKVDTRNKKKKKIWYQEIWDLYQSNNILL